MTGVEPAILGTEDQPVATYRLGYALVMHCDTESFGTRVTEPSGNQLVRVSPGAAGLSVSRLSIEHRSCQFFLNACVVSARCWKYNECWLDFLF